MTSQLTEVVVADPRRWKALGFVALAQLIVALDATVVSIALPSAQAGLAMSDLSRQWVIGAYTLAFGSLLLVGGRIADLVGHKRTFVIGLAGFAGASALGGAAVNGDMLIAARALQGVCGAFLTPSALALVTVAFSEERERAKAFGIYGAISSGGLAAGLVLGGVLTEYLTWRWAFFLSVPCALVAGGGVLTVVHPHVNGRPRRRLDVPGALLSATGLIALVLALASAESAGWTAGATILLSAAALGLLTVFVVVESTVAAPLLPLRVVVQRRRGGVYLALVFILVALFGLFLALTYYLQVVKGFSPVVAGLAFLPVTVGLAIGATQVAGRLPRVPPGPLMGCGFLLAAAGMLVLTRLDVDSGYLSLVLPAELLVGVGAGIISSRGANLSTAGARPEDAGVASAVFVTVQQLGASIGAITLNSIAAGAAAAYAAAHQAGRVGGHPLRLVSMVHGFATAMWWTVGILVVAAVITAILVNGCPSPLAGPADSEPTMADETMADETMADETMADETMADETMADETMARQTMADDG